jgi:hypothetical protein
MADARGRCDRETASIAFPESTMQSLSPMDGSAAAVRQAAAAATAVDDPARLAVERELDRLNIAAIAQVSALAQHMSGMLLVQAILLAAYFGVLIGGWSLPLPGKRWLLVAVAVSASSVAAGSASGPARADRSHRRAAQQACAPPKRRSNR